MGIESLHRNLVLLCTMILLAPLASTGEIARAAGPAAFPARDPDNSGKTYLIGAIGDSLTAATLADTSATETSLRNIGLPEIENVRSLYQNKSTLSWVSGQDIDSHLNLYTKYLRAHGDNTPVQVLNEAVPGATSDEIASQVSDIVAAAQASGAPMLKYVTLMIGANDACKDGSGGPTNEQFYGYVMAALKNLATIQEAEPVRVLVSSIPNIPVLNRPEIRDFTTVDDLTCGYVRQSVLGFCDSMLSWTTPDELALKEKVVDDKNQVLRQVVSDAQKAFPNLSIQFSESFHNYNPQIGDLAEDCFHPTGASQAKISSNLWADQPWFH